MSSGAAQVFVYYRVRAADVPALIADVQSLQAHWRAAFPGLACTLSRRVGDQTDPVTLMETYCHATEATAAWHDAIENRARDRLAMWIVGERHVEVFVACA